MAPALVITVLGFATIAAMILYLGWKLRGRIRHLDHQLQALKSLKHFDQVLENQGRVITEMRGVLRTLSEGQREVALTSDLNTMGFRFPLFFGGWSVDAFLAREILLVLERDRPRVILELGSGLSTVFIATALERLGLHDTRHIAVDHLDEYLEATRRQLETAGLSTKPELWLCPLGAQKGDEPAWYEGVVERLAGVEIDLVIVDGPPGSLHPRSRQPALGLLEPLLSKNGVLFLDDAIRPDEQAIMAAWRAQHPDMDVVFNGRGHGYAMVTRAKSEGGPPKRETVPPAHLAR